MSEALSGISPNDLPDIESDDEDEEDTSQNDGTQEGKSDMQFSERKGTTQQARKYKENKGKWANPHASSIKRLYLKFILGEWLCFHAFWLGQ